MNGCGHNHSLLRRTTRGDTMDTHSTYGGCAALVVVTLLVCTGLVLLAPHAPDGSSAQTDSVTDSGYSDGCHWEVRGDTVFVTGEGELSRFAADASWIDDVRLVIIDSGITRVREDTFSHFGHLESVVICDADGSVDARAFSDCPSVTSVYIGSGRSVDSSSFDFPFDSVEAGNSYILDDGVFVADNGSGVLCASFGDSGTTGDCGWVLSNGTVYITGNGDMDRNYRYWQDLPGGMGRWCYDNPWGTSIRAVVIGDGVTSVGEYAFSGCHNLASVTIGGSVSTVRDDAFSDCPAVTSLTLPVSLDMGSSKDTFGASSIQSLYFTCGNGNCVDYTERSVQNTPWYHSRDSLTYVDFYGGIRNVGDYLLSGCGNITNVDIYCDATMTVIGDHAFENCDSLTGIALPMDLKTIGGFAFQGCDKLSFIRACDGVDVIMDFAFYGCTSLTGAELGASVIRIGAFGNCTSLTKLNFTGGAEEISDNAFQGCTALQTLDLGTVTYVGDLAFAGCTGLTSVTVNAGSVGTYAFYGCTSLTSVRFGDGMTRVDSEAFPGTFYMVDGSAAALSDMQGLFVGSPDVGYVQYAEGVSGDCTWNISGFTLTVSGNGAMADYGFGTAPWAGTAVRSVVFGDGVTAVGAYALSGCTRLTSVDFGRTVEVIGDHAFDGCHLLPSVSFGNSVRSIGDGAFHDCSLLETVIFGHGLRTMGADAFDCRFCDASGHVITSATALCGHSFLKTLDGYRMAH